METLTHFRKLFAELQILDGILEHSRAELLTQGVVVGHDLAVLVVEKFQLQR